jgi:hypothetical protein
MGGFIISLLVTIKLFLNHHLSTIAIFLLYQFMKTEVDKLNIK